MAKTLILDELVVDFVCSLAAADRLSPVAVNMRTEAPIQPGIGPHTENQTVRLAMEHMAEDHPLKICEPHSKRVQWGRHAAPL